ncbi:hypothetical protein UQW22_10085 [Isoptericola halotolerans]|uniref:hypothetical protein n=1 Tax=Isoptericola halotolerans TaxID=300560 RepID=UPI00388D758D
MRRLLSSAGIVLTMTALAACTSSVDGAEDAEATPSESTGPAVEKNAEYSTVEDFRDAAVLAGLDCPAWEERTGMTHALAAGDCDDETVLSIFDSAAQRDDQAAALKALSSEPHPLLLGPNWMVNSAPETLDLLQPILGGEVDSEPAPEPETPEVTKKDLKASARVKEKECFGSAGCLITVEPVLDVKSNYLGVDEGGFEVTIEYRGGEDGPIVRTIEVDEGGEYSYREETVSTASSDDKVKVKVTDIHYPYSG